MVSLGHIAEEVVTGQVDIVNDLAQVGIEIGVSQVDQVVCKKMKDIVQLVFQLHIPFPLQNI